MQLWKWLNSTVLMAPDDEGGTDAGKADKLGGPPSGEADKGSTANPVEYGFEDAAFDGGPTDFVVEDGPSKSEKVDSKATREADEAAAAAEDTTKAGEADDTVKAAAADDKKKSDPGEEDDDSQLPKGVRRRLERANRQRDAALAEAEDLRKQVKKADDDPAGINDKTPVEAPNAADFDNYEDYLEAKALYEKSKSNPKPKVESKKADPEPKKEERAKPDPEVVEAISAIGEEIGSKHADLWGKVTANGNPLGLQITRDMLLAISDADNPATILQAMADNPALSKEIAALPARQQVRRIAKLDTAEPPKKEAKKADPKPAPKLSEAPEPITPGTGQGKVDGDPISDFTSFERQREAEETVRSKDFW